ncbi:ABC transporter ATP-binding protein [Flavobacteriaceae bacterium TP-CH-4]|uniref:ABC transporter ATP-binding protein n=1 Tax=Pelagihabitans pacificus TaxID=2696054 RepID=A0A967ASR5_9FLAO|nr:ABC transporter ATP-binding protein [Pelagihabitans pacificus]NHF59573.1 ABC transporter ATP-binding protein [Pelagihabitans pacificus]
MNEYAIKVEGLTKRFGDFTAVDAITFNVSKGEIFGFLGANGAGKTTAMRMLIGLSKPTEGTGYVAGFDIRTEAEKIKKGIGYMSQKFSLYNDLTVKENIRFYGGIYGLSKKQITKKTTEIMEELGLFEVAKKPVAALPLGWKQRLAFAVSMVHDPEIVFLDEPTGGVDPHVRRQFWETIYQQADAGRTIFVTTHYMDEAEYCDRVSIMVAGKVEALDSPDNLKNQYDSETMDEVFLKLAR